MLNFHLTFTYYRNINLPKVRSNRGKLSNTIPCEDFEVADFISLNAQLYETERTNEISNRGYHQVKNHKDWYNLSKLNCLMKEIRTAYMSRLRPVVRAFRTAKFLFLF